MKPRVYVETSVINYLTSRPSENLRNAARLTRRKRSTSIDPVLAELWAIKQQLNEEANFSLDAIVTRARTFTIEEARARVRAARDAEQVESQH